MSWGCCRRVRSGQCENGSINQIWPAKGSSSAQAARSGLTRENLEMNHRLPLRGFLLTALLRVQMICVIAFA